jgi:hypothetical protein
MQSISWLWRKQDRAKTTIHEPARSREKAAARLRLECLEDRRLLATITPSIFTEGAGSLRAAVIAANQTVGQDIIKLKAGTYRLTRANDPGQENAAATGDLDIAQSLVI